MHIFGKHENTGEQPSIIVSRDRYDKDYKGLTDKTIKAGMSLMKQEPHLRETMNIQKALHGSEILQQYLRDLSNQRRENIRGIQLTFRNFIRECGIGLGEVEIHPLSSAFYRTNGFEFWQKNETGYPTIGVRPWLRSKNRRIIGFEPPEEGGEQFTALSECLSIDKYSRPQTGRTTRKVPSALPELTSLSKHRVKQIGSGDFVADKPGYVVGVPVDVLNLERLIKSGRPFGQIAENEDANNHNNNNGQQIYIRQHLTRVEIDEILSIQERAQILARKGFTDSGK